MQLVSDNCRALTTADTRMIDVRVKIGDKIYPADYILSLRVYHSIGEQGLSIGNANSDYCVVTIATTERLKSGVSVLPFGRVYYYGNTGEWLQLGSFTATSISYDRGTAEITAYDRMYFIDNRCTYQGNASQTVTALKFPCKMQDLLDYTCKIKGIECDFKCQDWTIETCPTADEEAEDDSRYYTHRQMLGYIAGAHGCNASFDNKGKLVFKGVGEALEYIPPGRCIEQTIDSEELFEVKGVRLVVGEDALFINDTGELWTEEMPGIIQAANPLGSIAVAEYIWKQMGGFSYGSCDLSRRGTGWIEAGDILETSDIVTSKKIRIIAQTVEYTFAPTEGFLEHIISTAENETESGNRAISPTASGGHSGGSSGMSVYFSVGNGTAGISDLMVQVVKLQFSAVLTCVPLFAVTVPFTVTTAGDIDFIIVYDGTAIITYTQHCEPGKHFKAINFPLVGTGNGGHTVSVFMKSEDGAGTVDCKNTYASVNGKGLQANAAWDGTISIKESISGIELYSAISIGNIADNMMYKPYNPTKISSIEVIHEQDMYNAVQLGGFEDIAGVITEDIPHEVVKEQMAGIAVGYNIGIDIINNSTNITEG